MTHLIGDLNRLCRLWCPMINECPSDHLCQDMKEIKKRIINIAAFDNE